MPHFSQDSMRDRLLIKPLLGLGATFVDWETWVNVEHQIMKTLSTPRTIPLLVTLSRVNLHPLWLLLNITTPGNFHVLPGIPIHIHQDITGMEVLI